MGKGGKGSYKHRQRQKQVACMAILALLVAAIAVLAVMYFTTFKPKDPKVGVPTMELLALYTAGYPATVTAANLTLNLQISIANPNKATFYLQEDGSQASLFYYASLVGTTPLLPPGPSSIPAQSAITISASLTVVGPNPLLGPHLFADVASGILQTSTSVTILGKVTSLHIFSHHSKVVSTCDINVSLTARGIESFSCQKSISLDT